MTDSLIERMAWAMAGLHITTASGTIVAPEDVARTALAAAREPTPEMRETGNRTAYKLITDPGIGEAVWQAMIDAALKD